MDDARRVGSLWLEANLLDRARAVIAAAPLPMYTGQLALAEGRIEDAIKDLKVAVSVETNLGSPSNWRMPVKLAEALHTAGRTAEAVEVLETSTRARGRAATGASSGYAWIGARERQAQLYRGTGRQAEARAIESELLTLLEVADDDHPIKRRLLERR